MDTGFAIVVAAAIPSIVTAMTDYFARRRTKEQEAKLQQIHELVNSTATQLRETATKLATAEGRAAGIAEGEQKEINRTIVEQKKPDL
jgi:hypothetical protein